jgi:hypothetical protein
MGRDAHHYGISIVRDRGIDKTALEAIRHMVPRTSSSLMAGQARALSRARFSAVSMATHAS